MAPFVTIDNVADFTVTAPPPSKANARHRTLLLAPPSLSAHPELLNRVVEAHDRSVTDIQMLDRLAMGLVNLPVSTYDVILLLTDADGTRTESQKLLARDAMSKVVSALKDGGRFRSQDGLFGTVDGPEKTEAILAGLVSDGGDGLVKPEPMENVVVPLRLRKKANGDSNGVKSDGGNGAVPLPINGKRKSVSEEPPKPAGVGFVDFSDDLDMITGEDDELIDEDDLLTESDLARPVQIPAECRPKDGKRRRRACKDCTCGLKEKLEAEDQAKRNDADAKLNAIKLETDDLAEVDFTVQGKVGSCGNCALGDAFRCDGCPYIGLPAFKPGEEVRLLNNDIQL